MALTFERHVARIQHVFGEDQLWRCGHLYSSPTPYKGDDRVVKQCFGDKPIERLRLLNGNNTHKACVEWIVADLDTHRKRDSVMAVRDSKSLADELLVIIWLFPAMIRAIDFNKRPGLFAAGYEVNTPEISYEEWLDVVVVRFNCDGYRVYANVYGYDNDDPDYPVPVLRESPALGT